MGKVISFWAKQVRLSDQLSNEHTRCLTLETVNRHGIIDVSIWAQVLQGMMIDFVVFMRRRYGRDAALVSIGIFRSVLDEVEAHCNENHDDAH